MGTKLVTLRREDHTYEADGRVFPLCVSDVLQLAGIRQPYPDIPSVRSSVERARELGETVHEWCEYLDNHGTDVGAVKGTAVLPYLLAYQRFRELHEPRWEFVEQAFGSEEIGCAGTPDRIGSILWNGQRVDVIADIKTPQKAEKHWQLQLSAYEFLSRMLGYRLFVIHLGDDASFKVRPYESEIETFLGAVHVAHWRLRNGARRS